MRNMNRTIIAIIAMIAIVTSVQAIEPTVVTFDNGIEGWTADPDCETINADGGNPGAYLNIAPNFDCGDTYVFKSRFWLRNDNDPAFIGDYTAKGPVRVSIDVNINSFDYHGWWVMAVEEWTELIVEFIDYDNPYTDEFGNTWPWTSVIYTAETFNSRDDGWKTFEIDIADPATTELPAGWTGFGGPETPMAMPQLPPDRTFADVMAGIDEIQFHTYKPGYMYGIGYLYDIDFDNITIKELPHECQGQEATVYVDYDGIVRGGQFDGLPYDGELTGTHGNDVIVGTDGEDAIQGLHGNDLICAGAGNDVVHGGLGDDIMFGEEGDDNLLGQKGIDYLSGGPGEDMVNGGPGEDTCVEASSFKLCGEY